MGLRLVRTLIAWKLESWDGFESNYSNSLKVIRLLLSTSRREIHIPCWGTDAASDKIEKAKRARTKSEREKGGRIQEKMLDETESSCRQRRIYCFGLRSTTITESPRRNIFWTKRSRSLGFGFFPSFFFFGVSIHISRTFSRTILQWRSNAYENPKREDVQESFFLSNLSTLPVQQQSIVLLFFTPHQKITKDRKHNSST